jgi:hypothetical protein
MKLSFRSFWLLLLSLALIAGFCSQVPLVRANSAPTFGTAENLTNGGLQAFPVASGNILAYVESNIVGQIVIRNLTTNKTADIPLPEGSDGCFVPSLSTNAMVFTCTNGDSDFRIYYEDISNLNWDSPAAPIDMIPEILSYSTFSPKIWSHYVAFDMLNGKDTDIVLYDLSQPYSEGVNPAIIGTAEPAPIIGGAIDEFQDGVLAWDGVDSTIKIYNLNDASPEVKSFAVSDLPAKISVNQTYIVWSYGNGGGASTIYYKSLADLAADPTEISSQSYAIFGPIIYADPFVYLSFSDENLTDGKLYYYDLETGQNYLAQENISLNGISQSMGILFYMLFPPLAINGNNIFWSNAPTENTGDIFSMSYSFNPPTPTPTPSELPQTGADL